MAPESLRQYILNLPNKPGVYKYYDLESKILYVGKAKDLKKRVSSYFTKQQHDNHKTKVLVSKIQKIEFVVVDSEYDALLLENSLIKEFQPRYNINLKDDKSYPYIKITKERFPRVLSIRNPVKDGSQYFGPYSSVNVMYLMLELIKKMYPIRNCKFNLSEANIKSGKFRLCLEYHIGNCKGPCVGLQNEAEYMEQIKQVISLLKGNLHEVKTLFKNQIKEAVEKLAFEEAHKIKIKLDLLEKYQAKSMIVNPAIQDVEVFSVVSDEKKGYVNYLRVTNGMITQTRNLEVKKILGESDAELLLSAIAEIRNTDESTAPEIILPQEIGIELKGFKVTIPQIGDKKKLLELSLKNAFYYKKEKDKMAETLDPNLRIDRVLENMKKDLRLNELPRHIECFDNSNFLGKEPVSACVVFKDAKPSKSDYRHFNIKTVEGPDDFASMYEVITRRYKRLLEEEKSLPQLIVVDGGKGQLSSSVKALKDLGLYGKIAILGIAKRLEELYFPEDPLPLYLDKKSETLRIIQHMRDEAHRFGITHHRNRRNKTGLATELEQIKGIGEKTAISLLSYFKSVNNIKLASLDDLKEITDSKRATIVFEYFQKKAE